eukprot:TRINITY_DN17773_c0_g1_i1.p2 TRINITY_DN17773_c0_g1~~TRINITY_DN17773_c0_g1_i1.p2  ORF type:complete len:117 (+),score=21.80 TRINITY_DN17773_c0_g1_i1:785-1135(+)
MDDYKRRSEKELKKCSLGNLEDKLTKQAITNEVQNINNDALNYAKWIETKELELKELQGTSNALLFEQDTIKAYKIPELELKANANHISLDADVEVKNLRGIKSKIGELVDGVRNV